MRIVVIAALLAGVAAPLAAQQTTRTPEGAVLNVAQGYKPGELTAEQEKEIGFIRKAAPTGELPNLMTLSLGLVLANAVICGVLSGPYPRYQARVEWIIPLGALLLLAQWWERSRGPISPAPDR